LKVVSVAAMVAAVVAIVVMGFAEAVAAAA
jgi:hypothetical protein